MVLLSKQTEDIEIDLKTSMYSLGLIDLHVHIER
jgi:predicted amidohydrolase